MKLQQKLTLILTTLFLTLFISACSSDSKPLIETKNLNAISQEKVTIKAINAEAYSWTQISGTKVILINANTSTLSFIAPEVQAEETLAFEVEALIASLVGQDIIKRERATVTVSPLEITTDNNDTNTITDTNTTNQTTITLKSIKLTIDKTSLNLDENTTLNAVALYSDKTTKDVTQEVKWISSDLNAVQITKHNLKTKQEKNIILQAKLNAVTSNAVALEIYNEINGYRLPPQPDETLNNSTLLGIDSNNNGVRDDVERWIYFRYKRPIEQAYMMQYARWYPQTLEDPVAAAASEELEKEHWNLYTCDTYLTLENINMPKNSVDFMENAYFNTKERMRAYIQFNEAMSGGVYHIPLLRDANKENCDFNITKMLEMEK